MCFLGIFFSCLIFSSFSSFSFLMLPTKRSLSYASPNTNRTAYSPPYDASYPHKRPTSRRSSSAGIRHGSVETDRDDETSQPSSSQLDPASSQINTGSNQDTPAADGTNEKDDGDAEEDDKDELVMDDDMHAQMEKVKEDMK
jgi:hypothetical protein